MKNLEFQDKLLIEKYMLNQLTEEEQQVFQQKLKQEQAFAEAFKFQLDIQQTMKHIEIQEIHQYLDELYSKQAETQPANNLQENKPDTRKDNIRRLSTPLKYAAAVILLIGASLLYFIYGTSSLTTDQLMAEHYSTPDLSFTVRGEDGNESEVINAYRNGDYGKVVQLTAQGQDNPKLQLARGISQLQTGQATQAVQTLKSLQSNNQYDDQATWYLAICYLKLNDKENTKTQLRMLVDGTIKSTEGWKGKANKLLSQL